MRNIYKISSSRGTEVNVAKGFLIACDFVKF